MNYIKSLSICSVKVSIYQYILKFTQHIQIIDAILYILEISKHPAKEKFRIGSDCDRADG